MTLGTYLTIMIRFGGLFLAFFGNVVIARTLEPTASGNFFSWLQFCIFISLFLRLGLDIFALKQGQVYTPKALIDIYIDTFRKNFAIITAVLVVGAFYAKWFLPDLEYLFSVIFIVLLTFNAINGEYLKSHSHQLVPILAQIALTPLILILFLSSHGNIIALVTFSTLIGFFIQAVFTYLVTKNKDLPAQIKQTDDIQTFHKTNILNTLISYLDIIILTVFCNPDVVGFYYLASRLANLNLITLAVLNGIFGPKYAHLWRNRDIDNLHSYFINNQKALIFLGTCSIILVFCFSDSLIRLIYGDKYIETVIYLKIMILGTATALFTGTSGYVLMMCGNEKIYFKILLITGLFSLVLLTSLTYFFEAIGAAIALTFCYFIKNIWAYLRTMKQFREWQGG